MFPLNPHFPSSIIHPIISLSAQFPPFFKCDTLTVWLWDRNRERHREIALWFVVIWSLILSDPHQPTAHCSLVILLLHQTKWPGRSFGRHGGFVFINNFGTASSQREAGFTSIINNVQEELTTEKHPTPATSPLMFQTVQRCSLLGRCISAV